ncbi:hypothetical protein [Mucilaginibacter phyllosphaerae]
MPGFYLFYTNYFVPATILIPVFAAVINYQVLPKAFKIILWFLIFSGGLNIVNLVGIRYGYNSITLLNIYTIFEFIFLGLYYSEFFEKKGQKVIALLMAAFTVACIINYFFIQNKIEFNTYTRSAGAVMLIVFSLLYILKQSNDEESWSANKYNWINAGILLYYASCLFMFAFSNYLLSASQQVNQTVWIIHDTIMIFEYILFAVGFSKCRTQQITSTY